MTAHFIGVSLSQTGKCQKTLGKYYKSAAILAKNAQQAIIRAKV